jgi:hypothetical protein
MHIVLIKTIKCYNNTNIKQVHKHDMCNANTMEIPPIINQNIHKNKKLGSYLVIFVNTIECVFSKVCS